MAYILFPGRQLLNTAFQASYLRQVLQMPLSALHFHQAAPNFDEPLTQIVFAVTSSNQAHSRYNPIPFHVRAIGVDRFARPLEMAFAIRYRIFGVPHYRPTPRFAEYVLKEIDEQSEGALELTPNNCVVLCSTPALMQQYAALGFAILPAEAGVAEVDRPATPIEVMQQMVAAGAAWAQTPTLRQKLAPATFDLWQDFPDIPRRILRLWRDPLLTDSGSLTEDRNYSSYAFGMSNRDIIELKYGDIKDAILPGKIVDEGCADGALLTLVAQDFPDSDLIGIEITGEFLARCQERQRAGEFGGSFVHFHQRNIMHEIFEAAAIDTTLCNSTVHELYSYGAGEQSVRHYFALKFAQTVRGGRLIIRDVVGPAAGDREVYLWLRRDDGGEENVFAEFERVAALEAHLNGLSTYGRFLRFARDFRAESVGPGVAVPHRIEEIDGETYAVLSLRAAAEFMSKKDYTDNWASEMHEAFAFWDFDQWKVALSDAGFDMVETPAAPAGGSRVYTNPWIVENRWQGRVALFDRVAGTLHPRPWPPTNIVLVGERPQQPALG